MSRLPILNFRQFSRILKKKGYFLTRQKGSHAIFENEKGETITVPNHPGKTLAKGLLRRFISDMGLTVDQFIRLSKKGRL